jgi:hypothetical protein
VEKESCKRGRRRGDESEGMRMVRVRGYEYSFNAEDYSNLQNY